jgi:hypothetical protein
VFKPELDDYVNVIMFSITSVSGVAAVTQCAFFGHAKVLSHVYKYMKFTTAVLCIRRFLFLVHLLH